MMITNKKRILATILTLAIVLSGVSITPKTVQAAQYAYTYTTGIPSRNVDITDGVVNLTVDGNSYQLTLRLTADDAACDQYGTCFIRYKNGAIYFASYELEGTSMVKHRLYLNGQAVYANKLLFKSSNKYIATHYEYNDVEYELPNLDVLRQQLGLFTATPVPTPTATATPVPTPTATATPVPTPTLQPTAAPTQTPNVVIDTNTETEVIAKFWLEQLKQDKITWEQFLDIIKVTTWKVETQSKEMSETWNIYDANGNCVYSKTVKTGTSTENGTSNSKEEEKNTGNATVETENKVNGEANANIKTDSTTTVTDNRNTTSPAITNKTSKKAHVKVSGSKIQWLDKDDRTKFTSFIRENGNFKLRTLKGSKVVAGGYIEKYCTYILRLKNGDWYAINLNNYKVAKLGGKAYKFFRNKRNFITHVVMKNGKKVDIKNLKVTKGKYTRNINKVTYKVSYKELLKK